MVEFPENGDRRKRIEEALREFLRMLNEGREARSIRESAGETSPPVTVEEQRERKIRGLPSELSTKELHKESPLGASSPSTKSERIPYFLKPAEKCFICGAEPIAGLLMPNSAVLYFCGNHFKTGRELAVSSWDTERARQRQREAMERWNRWREQRLAAMMSTEASALEEVGDICENCGSPFAMPIVNGDGTLIPLCPDCARESSTFEPDMAV